MNNLSAITAKITRAVKKPEKCILRRPVSGAYDTSTGSTVAAVPKLYDCEAIFAVSAGYQFDQYLKRAGDLFARIDADNVDVVPREGDVLEVERTGQAFNVVVVKPFAGLGALEGYPAYLLVVRQ